MRSYRGKLLLGMMVVVIALTVLGLFLAERKVAIETRLDFLHDFQNELDTLHGVQEVRHAALAERLRALALRPRIHAALEDNALDLCIRARETSCATFWIPRTAGRATRSMH